MVSARWCVLTVNESRRRSVGVTEDPAVRHGSEMLSREPELTVSSILRKAQLITNHDPDRPIVENILGWQSAKLIGWTMGATVARSCDVIDEILKLVGRDADLEVSILAK